MTYTIIIIKTKISSRSLEITMHITNSLIEHSADTVYTACTMYNAKF